MHSLILAVILASTIQPMDLTRLPSQSSLVITGYVRTVRTMPDRTVRIKIATVRVVSVLRGNYSRRTLQVRTQVGLVGFDRELSAGDSGVLFLTPSSDGVFEAAYPGSFALFEKGTVKAPD